MKILVQKFGGTSVATPEARAKALEHIKRSKKEGYAIVVVVSAMGRSPQPYATDSLLKLIRKEANPKHKDLLMSCGENIAVAVMTDLLESQNISASPLVYHDLGILTNSRYEDAKVLEVDPSRILECLKKGEVAVVPGFQGVTREGNVTTLGRGGSDTTAAALGAILKAELVEIYTDVDGVYSADPHVVSEARVISEITFQEVGEMAHHGAKVVHPKAVSFALESKIPIRVRSTFSNHPGTLIHANPIQIQDKITAVTHIPHMAYIEVQLEEKSNLEKARHDLFKAFADAGISLDFITVSSLSVYFVIRDEQVAAAKKLLHELNWEFKIEPGYAKVSIIGAGMRGKPGVMYRVVDALYRARIPLYHSTDSHITIACLVQQAHMENAVKVLYQAFQS